MTVTVAVTVTVFFQMDFIIIDHGHHMAPAKAMQLAFTVWAVGSCVAGFSDAFISTVAYSQAASIGQRYTHVSSTCSVPLMLMNADAAGNAD